ncbi:MAG: cytochrome c [Bacteroidetes bacterium]|nr:cytochrome c [Bacteroidota bacterium]
MRKSILVAAATGFVALVSFVTPPQNDMKASMARGKTVYETVCLACHQADAAGVPNMNPTLIKTKWVLGNKTALATIVLKGLKGGEIVMGEDTFNNPMPAQESMLTDQQIADVLTYVRNSFGNKASAVTVAEVKAARAGKAPAANKKTPAPKKKA